MAVARSVCKVEGCEKYVQRRALCAAHLARLLRNGDVAAHVPVLEKPKKGFTNFDWLVRNARHSGDACLVWPFGRFANGYGQVRSGLANKVASREMCILAHGEPPTSEHEAAHSCGNGHLGCVNPRHLRWATKAENETDKHLHRAVRGAAAVALCG